MLKIEYKLKFKSDFHFGSGSGIPGVIDCGLKYNSYGVPDINGRTIKGILRDGVENIVLLKSDDLSIVGDIFGREGEDVTAFRFSTPVLEEKYERRIAKSKYLQRSISSIEFHNRINSETNTAEEGALFSREVGPKVFVYTGRVIQIKECPPEIKKKYLYYLVCGMRFVTHIGGSRRRGKGLVRFEISEIKDNGSSFHYKEVIKKGTKR